MERVIIMTDRVNQPKWRIQNTRVYGDGQSFNCTNKITAEQLYHTLTEYEKTLELTESTDTKLDNITKQVIQIQMTLNILQHDLDKLKEALK